MLSRICAGKESKYPEITGPYLLGTSQQDRFRPFSELVDAYVDELVRRGSDPGGKHVSESRRIITAITSACGWKCLADIRADDFSTYLANQAKEGKRARTQHVHHTKITSFLNWCMEQNWLEENPIVRLRKVKVGSKGKRRLRRAYTNDEWRRLLEVAHEPRRTVYIVAAFSGFRRKELSLMQKRDCDPRGDNPRWTVRPEITKNGMGAELPMLLNCAAALLPIWEALPNPDSPLLVDKQGRCAVPHGTTLVADLKTAGIPRKDGRDRWVDFHSLRYTFCTWMSKMMPMHDVQALMRHSTITLTMDLYKDQGLEDISKTIWTLPPLFGGNAAPAKEDGYARQEHEEGILEEGQPAT